MYKRIMIVVDAAPTSRAAVKEGVALAKSVDAEVLFFSVLPRYVVPVTEMPLQGMLSPVEFQRQASSNAQRLLAAATVTADKAGVRCQSAVGAGADDAQCIVEAARKRRAGVIVVASAGRSALTRLVNGSVIPGLITHATVPVLVCRAAVPMKVRRPSVGVLPPPRQAKAAVGMRQ